MGKAAKQTYQGSTANEVRACLASMFEQEPFANSQRLQSFLTYIVEETFAGREERILGKTIAAEVYGRKIDADWKDEPIVRVDAGRLRRCLEEYYSGPGKNDPVQIRIPTGAYKPRFVRPQDRSYDANKLRRYAGLGLGLFALFIGGVFVGAVLYWRIWETSPIPLSSQQVDLAKIVAAENARREIERRAMFDKSPTSLQAYDYAQNARALIFPPTSLIRLQSALKICHQVIELDSSYFGGYAVAAQIYAFRAHLGPPAQAEALMKKAKSLASEARRLNPTSAWVQTALAWVAFVDGEFERALELTRRSMVLDRADHHNRKFNGMILALNGDFAAARQLVEPYANSDQVFAGSIDGNIYAVTSFYLKDYEVAVKYLNKIVDDGGVMSPLTTSYLAAAYYARGEHRKAADITKKLSEAWPDFQPEKFFHRLFRHPEHAQSVVDLLRKANSGNPDQ